MYAKINITFETWSPEDVDGDYTTGSRVARSYHCAMAKNAVDLGSCQSSYLTDARFCKLHLV